MRVRLYAWTPRNRPRAHRRRPAAERPEQAAHGALYWKGAGCCKAMAPGRARRAGNPRPPRAPDERRGGQRRAERPASRALSRSCQRLMGRRLTQADANIFVLHVSFRRNARRHLIPVGRVRISRHWASDSARISSALSGLGSGTHRFGRGGGGYLRCSTGAPHNWKDGDRGVVWPRADANSPKRNAAPSPIGINVWLRLRAMIADGIAYAVRKRAVQITVNGILRACNHKGLQTVRTSCRSASQAEKTWTGRRAPPCSTIS